MHQNIKEEQINRNQTEDTTGGEKYANQLSTKRRLKKKQKKARKIAEFKQNHQK